MIGGRSALLGARSSGVDSDALAYIALVEAADGQALEIGVNNAINTFFRGCKSDGIWSAIKASCILAGARTLAGALVPLAGTAPTNVSFVGGDYNRKNGLTGNGSTKYLNSNRLDTADPRDDMHLAAFKTVTAIAAGTLVGTTNGDFTNISFIDNFSGVRFASRSHPTFGAISGGTSKFMGLSRGSRSNYTTRGDSGESVLSVSSVGAGNGIPYFIFDRNGSPYKYSGPICFYSIGTSIDLNKLRLRLVALFDSFATEIP